MPEDGWMRDLTLDRLPRKVLSALDIETVFKVSRCVIAAERLEVFRCLSKRERSAADVAGRTGIHPRYCEPFLELLVFLGLLNRRNNRYRNSALTDRHFIRARSLAWTRFWSLECTRDYEALTLWFPRV